MKWLSLVLFVLCAPSAFATDMREALGNCSKEAHEKSLKGDEYKSFMHECMQPALAQLTQQPPANVPALQPGTNPINALIAYSAMAQMKVMTGNLDAQLGKTDDYRQQLVDVRAIGTKVDEVVPMAVKAAKGKQDLIKAIKEFYAAESKYIANGVPDGRIEKAASDRLSAEMDASEKSLELEMKLAGIN